MNFLCPHDLVSYSLKCQSRLQQTTFINIFLLFSEKLGLDVSSESSAKQSILMKNQALFSSKDKSRKSKCCLPQFLFGALRINIGTLLLLEVVGWYKLETCHIKENPSFNFSTSFS